MMRKNGAVFLLCLLLLFSGCQTESTANTAGDSGKENVYINGSIEAVMDVMTPEQEISVPVSLLWRESVYGDRSHGIADLDGSFGTARLSRRQEWYRDKEDTVLQTDDGAWAAGVPPAYDLTKEFAGRIQADGRVSSQNGLSSVLGTFSGMETVPVFDAVWDAQRKTLAQLALSPDLLDAVLADRGDSPAVYTTQEEGGALVSVGVDGAVGSVTENQTTVSLSVSVSFAWARRGEMTASDVALPEDVTVSDASSGSGLFSFSSDEILRSLRLGGILQASATKDNFFGCYGNTPVSFGTPWSLFASDGWVLDDTCDGWYAFVEAENPSYAGTALYVFGKKGNTVTCEDVMSQGCFGYTVTRKDGGALVPMDWNGVTFGSTASDVQEIYGVPEQDTTVSDVRSLTYRYPTGTMVFSFSHDVLYSVDCRSIQREA